MAHLPSENQADAVATFEAKGGYRGGYRREKVDTEVNLLDNNDLSKSVKWIMTKEGGYRLGISKQKHIAYLCGFFLVKELRAGIKGLDTTEMVNEYQECAINAVRCLKKFLDKPTQANYESVIDALQVVMNKSAEDKKYCNKHYSGQIEFEL